MIIPYQAMGAFAGQTANDRFSESSDISQIFPSEQEDLQLQAVAQD